MTVLGIEMTDKEPIIGWEAVKMDFKKCKPIFVIEAEKLEERAYRAMCEVVNSFAFEGWNDDNIDAYTAYEEANKNLELAHKVWDSQIKPRVLESA